MARYGLGNFQYDIEVSDGGANFTFFDPEDATNTEKVSIKASDFPAGVTSPDSRQVADQAYLLVEKALNEKRDARIRQQAADSLQAKHDEDARQRAAANTFMATAQDVQTDPHHTEKDGTRVYNLASPENQGNSDSGKKK